MISFTVQYRGRTYAVPDWTVAVATDRFGSIKAFREKPWPDRVTGMWLGSAKWVRLNLVQSHTPELPDEEWTTSLQIIEPLRPTRREVGER